MSHDDVIADTSFVVAIALKTDRKHADCLRVFRQYRRIILPQSTLAEIAFMITRAGGIRATAYFFKHLKASKYEPVPLATEDFTRTAEILEQYADSRVDLVDASVAAVAERLFIGKILTLDQRDFSLIRPTHIDHFELLPQ